MLEPEVAPENWAKKDKGFSPAGKAAEKVTRENYSRRSYGRKQACALYPQSAQASIRLS